MSKYERLTAHLHGLSGNEWTATFQELEKVLGFSLPSSARTYNAWWANDVTGSRHSNAWLSAGWNTSDINLTGKSVTFLRVGAVREAAPVKSARNEPQPAPKVTSNMEDLPLAPGNNPLQVAVNMSWRTLGPLLGDRENGLIFPDAPEEPGLYRFRLSGGDTPKSYIGETMQLKRRFSHYRNPSPSQATNIRINALFLEHLAAGHKIEIDVIVQDAQMNLGTDLVKVDFF
jgi:Nuclease subunit of the excinuclease complex